MARLYRLLALRNLGLPLDEIGVLLDGDDGVAGTVRNHLARVERQAEALDALKTRLTRLLAALEAGDSTADEIRDALEAMSMFEKYYTPEHLQQLEERRRTLGDEEIKRVEDEWRDLYAQVHEHRTNGTDPSDPAVQALVTRSGELIQMFTGGDPEIAASLKRMYEQEGPQRASRAVADPEDLAYLETACPTRS